MEAYRHKVQVYETDNMGIVHHSNYIRFMEEARVDFMERSGYGYEKMLQEGVVSPVVSVSCDYKSPAAYPDILDIYVKVQEMSPLKVTIAYRMECGGRLICTASSVHCFIDEKTKRPVKLQDRFVGLYEIFKKSLDS